MSKDCEEERENAEFSYKRRYKVETQSCEIPVVRRVLQKAYEESQEKFIRDVGKCHHLRGWITDIEKNLNNRLLKYTEVIYIQSRN